MKEMKGFTLVELMISMGVTMVLMAAVYMSVNSAQRHSSGIERKVAAQQDVKPALDLMAMEIGMASYNPTAANLWGGNPHRGIQEATTNSIRVEMDIGSGGDGNGILGDHPNEVIRYSYDTANQYITRETNYGGGQPFLGDVPAKTRAVRVINNTLNIPLLRYYNGTGAQTTTVADIRRIDITLAVETENVDPSTNQRRRLIYSTSVIPRNHGIQ